MAYQTVSYKVKIKQVNVCLEDTLSIYRDALTCCIQLLLPEYSFLEAYENKKDRFNQAEKLLHSTAKNKAKYREFDQRFPKFPSYLRRDAIQQALGKLDSFFSNRKTNPNARLGLSHFEFPTFYKKEQFKSELKKGKLIYFIKIYHKKDWVWFPVNLRKTDLDYIKYHVEGPHCHKIFAPVLKKQNKKFYLTFAFQMEYQLNKTKLDDQTIIGVDLGLNSSAVCCAMDATGTVYDRFFSNQPKEKDQMHHLLNQLKKKQQQSGLKHKQKRLWDRINHLNQTIARKTAKDILDFALKNKADVIVLEHLSNFQLKGKRSQRLHLWKKRFILKILFCKAHLYGIKIRTIHPAKTSQLAFDGSGLVERNKSNYACCVFPSGKQYNSDLNASYNIGSRYYIKEYKKSMSAKRWSQCVANDPCIEQRIQGTLSTLINLNAVRASF